ncbi:Na(+)/H(+) antiporter subunit C [Actinotalea caeni]|uniref:Na(+)/H(+) antiporter subunit C n=1 Tax=Actinotalea caeni TaxID=1348467 RepID=UPI0012E1284F
MELDISPALVLVLAAGVLVGCGVYLVLERSLSRVIVGFILIGNGVNTLFLIASGRAGGPPLVGTTPTEEMADPLPQAMVLTAIVITLGLSAFVLAMAYRSWQLHGHDEVQDDLEDRRIAARLARVGEPVDRADEGAADLDVEAAEARDETEETPVPPAPPSDQVTLDGEDPVGSGGNPTEPDGPPDPGRAETEEPDAVDQGAGDAGAPAEDTDDSGAEPPRREGDAP